MKIKVHPDITKTLMERFQVSHQTVSISLRYFNNSPLAIQIREAAKEALLAEAKKVIVDLEK